MHVSSDAEQGELETLEIAHVVRSDAFAGVERYVCVVSNALADRGHRVAVVGGDPERMRHELRETVEHAPASSTPRVFRALAAKGRLAIVHAHMTAAETAALAARPWNRAPVVSTRHFPDRRGRRIPAALSGLIRRRLAKQIAISRFVAGGIGEPSVLLPNGVPHRSPAALESPTVLMMQRLEPEKEPELGLRAWARSGLAAQGWQLAIAGDGRLMSSVRSLAAELDVGDSVQLLGSVTDTDSVLGSASIFLAPAPAEPFGLAVVEAMARGIPVVAAEGGAHLETLGASGFLFPPGDVAGAAECLIALAEDRSARLAEGERLRRRQQQLFSLDRHVDALEDLYASALGGQ
jgi:glycosyltransferase involved in cell wall biosynthesis